MALRTHIVHSRLTVHPAAILAEKVFPLTLLLGEKRTFSLYLDSELPEGKCPKEYSLCVPWHWLFTAKHAKSQYPFTAHASASWKSPFILKALLPFPDFPNKINFSFWLWNLLALGIGVNHILLYAMFLILQFPIWKRRRRRRTNSPGYCAIKSTRKHLAQYLVCSRCPTNLLGPRL